MTGDRPRVGVSRCLLGESVRYDGGHKADRVLLDRLAEHVEWVPVCPELEVGMGVPREPVHLVAAHDGVESAGEQVRMIGITSGEDWTSRLTTFAARRVAALASLDLSGFVLKEDSPSCGVSRVRVRRPDGLSTRTGRGLFTEALVGRLPHLPIEDEARLQDPRLRQHFVERIFAYTRVQRLFGSAWTMGELLAFHTRHKFQLLSHSRVGYTDLGRLVANGHTMSRATLASRYVAGFMTALSAPASPGRHIDVMQHMLGFLKDRLDNADRQRLLQLMSDYRAGKVPLAGPLASFRQYVRVHAIGYLEDQTYLESTRGIDPNI